MESRHALLRAARTRLADAGFADPGFDAELLLGRCLGVMRSALIAAPEATVSAADAVRFGAWLERYAAGEPLAYLEGCVGFRRLELAVDSRVLVPRADSEVVVELCLDALGDCMAPRVVDVGTGSGCLLLALLDERPDAVGIGVDRSADALAVATLNAQRTGLADRCELREGDWLTPIVDASADLVVSNPPYVEPSEELGRGVAEFEPALALFTPPADPLAAYRALFADAPRVLRPDGILVLEIGAGRGDEILALGRGAGFRPIDRRADLGGVERALGFVLGGAEPA